MQAFPIVRSALPAILLLAAGCEAGTGAQGGSNLKVDDPVAMVGQYKVAPEIMDLYAEARTRQKFEALPAAQKQEILEEALKLIAIAEDARAAGMHKDPEVAARIELQTMNALAQARIGRLVEEASIDEQRLRSAYETQYVTEPKTEYKARHILVKTEDEAKGVISELEGGADFAALATEKSVGPSAKSGGDLGWFARDAMVKPFADAVAGMESGQFSKVPVQTQFGYHVILSEGTRTAPPPAFESVQESLRATVQQDLVEDFIENTRAAADVRVLVDLEDKDEAETEEQPAENGAETG